MMAQESLCLTGETGQNADRLAECIRPITPCAPRYNYGGVAEEEKRQRIIISERALIMAICAWTLTVNWISVDLYSKCLT